MSESKRKMFSGEFKAKVALEAIRGIRTVNEIGREFGVHPTQVGLYPKGRLRAGKRSCSNRQAACLTPSAGRSLPIHRPILSGCIRRLGA